MNRREERLGAPRRDAGMTLIEVVVTTALLGLIVAVVAAAVTLVFRSESGITSTVAESHDVQQAVNYFHLDVQSGPHDPAAYRGSAAVDGGTGCSDTGDANVFRYDDGERRIAYRLSSGPETASLDRFECRFDGSSWIQESLVNIADALALGGDIVTVDVLDPDVDGEVDRVEMDFAQRADVETVAATPRAETGVEPASSGECGSDPLEAALKFSTFVSGDVFLHGQNVLGTLAVGGTLGWTPALGIAQTDKNQDYGGVSLYAGAIDWSYPGTGTLNVNGGDVALGGSYHLFTSGSKKGQVYSASAGTGKYIDAKKAVVALSSVGVIDFAAQFDDLKTCSNLLGELPFSCSAADCAFDVRPSDGNANCNASSPPVYTGTGKFCVKLGSKGAQILNIPETELAEITEFSHAGGLSQSHPLIINVMDTNGDSHIDFTMTTSSWQNVGNTKNVLINFPEALTVTIDQPLFGTVLAPFAHVETIGNVQGGIIAASWTHQSGTVNNDGDNFFNGTIDWS